MHWFIDFKLIVFQIQRLVVHTTTIMIAAPRIVQQFGEKIVPFWQQA